MILVCAYTCIPLVHTTYCRSHSWHTVWFQFSNFSSCSQSKRQQLPSLTSWALQTMLCSCLHVRLPVNITPGFAYIPPRSIYRIWFCFHSAINRALPIQLQLLLIQWVSVWFASWHWQGTEARIRAIKARQSGWQLLMRLMRTDSKQSLSMCGYFPHSLSLSNQCVGFSQILVQFL